MVFTHVVTFKWRSGAPSDATITDALTHLTSKLDGVQSYLCGPDAGMTAGAYDFAVVGRFDDRDAFIAYRDHPEHQRILNEMVLPNLESRTVVQLEDTAQPEG